MARDNKTLGIVLLATLAACIGLTSPASATMFHSEFEKTQWTGTAEGTSRFEVDELGGVQCTGVQYKGTTSSKTVSAVLASPTYAGCKGNFLGIEGFISPNGCSFQLQAGTVEGGNNEGSVDIVCSGGEIALTTSKVGVTKCTTHIPPQTGKKTITYFNTGSGSTREITAELSLTGLTYSQTEGSGLGKCPSTTDTKNGTYTAKALITGEEDGVFPIHFGIWAE